MQVELLVLRAREREILLGAFRVLVHVAGVHHVDAHALIENYDGHPTDLEVVSVTDEKGTPRPYTRASDGGVLSLTIAAKDYVHGDRTYVITYRQSNVTRYFADTGNDEFYWDTNGTGWAQSFDRVTAIVHLGSGLADALQGTTSAYRGVQGSTEAATVERTGDGYRFGAGHLGPHENLTFAIGFAPGTFAGRPDGLFDTGWGFAAVAGLLLCMLAVVGAIVARVGLLRDGPGRGTIIPEYVPPKEGLLLAADVTRRSKKAVAAQTLDLAVSGRMRVLQTTGFNGKTRPSSHPTASKTTAIKASSGHHRRAQPRCGFACAGVSSPAALDKAFSWRSCVARSAGEHPRAQARPASAPSLPPTA
ncbi:DUF2207 domain-containing protein [Leifsonia sp. McL0607]|uniref:DUF2207 domain-containing protein n=1 Tax=Leifsonia sp. McL0607 TaxID=3415672 RepID=UPI003CFB29A6